MHATTDLQSLERDLLARVDAYSRFISGLAKAGIELDRKVMADIAMHEPAAFKGLVAQAQAALK